MKRHTPYQEWTEEERERKRHLRRLREGHPVLALIPNLPPLGTWTARGVCTDKTLGLNPEWFDQPSDRPHVDPHSLFLEQRQLARTCGPCPVRSECLEEARHNRFTGTWGGVLRLEVNRRVVEHDLVALHERTDYPKESAA